MSRCALTSCRTLQHAAFPTLILLLCGVAEAFSGTDLAQDVRDLRQLQPWHVSDVSASEVPAQTCGITDLSNHSMLRLDLQLAPEVSDSDANSRISALDRKTTAFLTNRGWSSMKITGNTAGIPDLTRCSQKQAAVTQIYKTTGRCTMGSTCAAYDGFTIMLYLPKTTALQKEDPKR